MKKRIMILLLILFFYGCQIHKESKTIVLFLPASFERWTSSDDMDTVIRNERIDEVNKILKSSGKNYKIEIHAIPMNEFMTIPNRSSEYGKTDIADRISLYKKLEEKNADIVDFQVDIPIYKEFESLDHYLNTEDGNKLMDEIPKNLYESNLINRNLYYIPDFNGFQQRSVYMKTDIYNQFKEQIDACNDNIKKMFQFMSDNYTLNDKEILGFNSIDNILLKYANVNGTNLYIDRQTKQIINPFENDDFLNYYQTASNINCRKLDTNRLTKEQQQNNNYIPIFKILSEPSSYALISRSDLREYTLIYKSEIYPKPTNGLGVLKNSKNKDEAFDFLKEMYTNQNIANVFVYGVDYKMDTDNNVIIKDEDKVEYMYGDYSGRLGSISISSPNIYQKANKRDLLFEEHNKVNMDYLVPQILDISEYANELGNLKSAFAQSIAFSKHIIDNESECLLFGLNQIENDKITLKNVGINQMIEVLQRQVDMYEK